MLCISGSSGLRLYRYSSENLLMPIFQSYGVDIVGIKNFTEDQAFEKLEIDGMSIYYWHMTT